MHLGPFQVNKAKVQVASFKLGFQLALLSYGVVNSRLVYSGHPPYKCCESTNSPPK